MDKTELFEDILKDTVTLLGAGKVGRKGTVSLSPEVAAKLQGLSSPPSRNAVSGHSKGSSEEMELLAVEVSTCTKCALCETRTQTVFGDGNVHADLVFVGEAPGGDEDRQGLPFVGRAGRLLTDIIEKGMKLKRSDVYICNVLKCRPPGNRDPRPDEVAHCESYLVRQLEFLQPKVICALGGHAAKTLLRTDASVGRLRGKWHFYHGIPLRVTYHPAYLLRSEADKRKTWMDVLEVLKVYNGEETPVDESSST